MISYIESMAEIIKQMEFNVQSLKGVLDEFEVPIIIFKMRAGTEIIVVRFSMHKFRSLLSVFRASICSFSLIIVRFLSLKLQ